MKYFFISAIILLCVLCNNLYPQTEKVRIYLKMAAQGKVDEVKRALPDLLADYPDHPGVQLLHGVVLEDAFKAVEIYDRIIKKHPDSEFAEEAWWRIIQFYAIKGDTARAVKELENFRKSFPASNYIGPANDVVRSALYFARGGNKKSQIATENHTKPDLDNKKTTTNKGSETPATTNKDLPKEKIQEKDTPGVWSLQVGVYSTKEAAKSEVERFRQMRFKAEITPKVIDGNTMYSVTLGEYTSKEAAESNRNIIKSSCGCEPIVIRK